MKFSEEDRVKLDRFYERLRKLLEDFPERMQCSLGRAHIVPGAELHVWERHKKLSEMSKDELMALIEADDVILGVPLGYALDRGKPLFDTCKEYQAEIVEFETRPTDKLLSKEELELHTREKRRIFFKHSYKQIRDRLEILQREPERFPMAVGEDQYIWDRFHDFCNMSENELMEEIEADNAILHG